MQREMKWGRIGVLGYFLRKTGFLLLKRGQTNVIFNWLWMLSHGYHYLFHLVIWVHSYLAYRV
jgi:hypothetical protein